MTVSLTMTLIIILVNLLWTPSSQLWEYLKTDSASKPCPHSGSDSDLSSPFSAHQVLANFLSSPLSSSEGSSQSKGWPYVAFDLDPKRVKAARSLGFPVIYGDASRPQVLSSAGIPKPKAIMVMYTGRQRAVQAVRSLSEIYKDVPIYARAQDLSHLLELKFAGATEVVPENTETSLRLGSRLLVDLGMRKDDVTFVRNSLRESMEFQAQEWGAKGGEPAESQLVIVAPPKLERGPKKRTPPTGDAVTLSKGEGQETTLASNRDLEKGLGGAKESGEIPLQGGVALASWRELEEGVLLSQEIALRKQLEDLKMEQVKLRFGFGFEQGPYCLVPSKEKRVKDEVSESEGEETADEAAPADVAPVASTADVSKPAAQAVEGPGAEAGENGARRPLAGQVEPQEASGAEASAGDDVSTPAGSSEVGEGVDGAAVSAPGEGASSSESTNGATSESGASVSASGQEDGGERSESDDSLWAWASSKVGSSVSGPVSKMQARGPAIDDDLGSTKEEDSVWSWASSRLGQRTAVAEEKEASIDDDLGSGAGVEEDSIWSWATRNRSGEGESMKNIDSEGFLRASVSWDLPSRGSATDVVQRIPLKELTRWVGRKRASEASAAWAEGDEGSGGSSDLNPVGELEDIYDEFSDGEDFSGYMTVEEVSGNRQCL